MLTTLCDIMNPEPCTKTRSVAPDGARADNSSWSYHRFSCVVNRRFAKGIPLMKPCQRVGKLLRSWRPEGGKEFDSQLRAGMTSMHAPWTGSTPGRFASAWSRAFISREPQGAGFRGDFDQSVGPVLLSCFLPRLGRWKTLSLRANSAINHARGPYPRLRRQDLQECNIYSHARTEWQALCGRLRRSSHLQASVQINELLRKKVLWLRENIITKH